MKRILVVEDEVALAMAYQYKLGRRYEVEVVNNAQSALEKLQKENFDLVLLDVMLPGGQNGFEVLKTIKANEKTAGIPVVILTNLDEDERKTAIDLGALDYIAKANSSLDELAGRVDELLK